MTQFIVIVDVPRSPAQSRTPAAIPRLKRDARSALVAMIVKVRDKPIDQPDRGSVTLNSGAPESDAIAPPSKLPTTSRRQTGANSSRSALHSGGIGVHPGLVKSRSTITFADSAPRSGLSLPTFRAGPILSLLEGKLQGMEVVMRGLALFA